MIAIILIILPVFSLILAGYVARRTNVLGPMAGAELNRFVVYLALPALLFDVTASSSLETLWQPDLIGAFGISALVVGALALVVQKARGRTLTDSAIDGLNASYPNTVYLGLPLCHVLLGPESLAPVTVLGAVAVSGLFIIAVIIVEIGQHAGHHPALMIAKVGKALLRNPLFVAPVAGAIWSASGLAFPDPVHAFLKLLAVAASPCALVALGLILAVPQTGDTPRDRLTVPALTILKLVVHPLLAAALALWVFRLPHELTLVAVILSALPTGTGPSMVAALYDRDMRVTSSTISLTTLIGMLTVSLCAALLGVSA